jgi:hypothetical protein
MYDKLDLQKKKPERFIRNRPGFSSKTNNIYFKAFINLSQYVKYGKCGQLLTRINEI